MSIISTIVIHDYKLQAQIIAIMIIAAMIIVFTQLSSVQNPSYIPILVGLYPLTIGWFSSPIYKGFHKWYKWGYPWIIHILVQVGISLT